MNYGPTQEEWNSAMEAAEPIEPASPSASDRPSRDGSLGGAETLDGHAELLATVLPANKVVTSVAGRLMRSAITAAYLDAVRPGTDSIFTVWGSPETMRKWL